MTTYQSKHAQINPAGSLALVSGADPPRRAARGVLILALVLGGLAAEGTVISGHGPGDQATTHHAAAVNRPAASAYVASPVRVKLDAFIW